jgi:hypothetical protein
MLFLQPNLGGFIVLCILPLFSITINAMMTMKSTKSISQRKAKYTTVDTTTCTSISTLALYFICAHLVGRHEVQIRRARAQISQCVPRPITQFCRQLRGMIYDTRRILDTAFETQSVKQIRQAFSRGTPQ